jgi:hypothetical protein
MRSRGNWVSHRKIGEEEDIRFNFPERELIS